MPLPAAPKLILSESERKQLLAFSRHRGTPKGVLLRVNIILGASEGIANHVLARNLETSLPTVLLWRRRFESDGLAGILEDRPRSGRPKEIPEERETAIPSLSRYVVGWMVADGESAELAKRLIADTCAKQGIEPGKLTIHADRGSSMTSKPVAFLMADLGITKTHSRPHVSDDNPYSESHCPYCPHLSTRPRIATGARPETWVVGQFGNRRLRYEGHADTIIGLRGH